MTKMGILQLKSSVDLVTAAAKIHSKVKSQQLLHVKNTEAVQGQITELWRAFTPRGSFRTHMYDCRLKGYPKKDTFTYITCRNKNNNKCS